MCFLITAPYHSGTLAVQTISNCLHTAHFCDSRVVFLVSVHAFGAAVPKQLCSYTATLQHQEALGEQQAGAFPYFAEGGLLLSRGVYTEPGVISYPTNYCGYVKIKTCKLPLEVSQCRHSSFFSQLLLLPLL